MSPVGSSVVWTATASGHGTTPVYQFRVGPTGGETQVVRDFSTSNTFTWNPMQEGTYEIQVTVKDSQGASTGETQSVTYAAVSRVDGPNAVVSPMSNPLVALYSAPPSTASSMYVQFKPLGSNDDWQSTAQQPVVAGESTNFLVAGMLPDTTYLMRHVLDDGTTSAPLTFKTGALPTNLTFPTFTVQNPPDASTDLSQGMVFHMGANAPNGTVGTVATDLLGNVVWYYDRVANNFPSMAPSLVPGGTVLLIGGIQGQGVTTLREVDLAGNTLRETNINAINAELAALGQHAITDFNHEAQRLPNGDTAVLAATPRTIDVNGTPTEYQGDMALILDKNFQVSWVWDPFAWLDTSRLPTLGEGPTDWTHANAIAWSPTDGNLLVSMRAQDWVVKIDYANGTGDGHVIWRLGQGGDFSMNSTDPSPWFSHQHDVRYVNDTTLVLFDDGNVRWTQDQQAHSRGQELVINEQTMQVTLVVNADLGNYAKAVGSAQRLPNGNLVFDSGFAGQTIEVLPDGTQSYVLQMSKLGFQYRAYIYGSLYGTPSNLVDPGFDDPPQGTGLLAETYGPTGSAWSFSGNAGVAANGSMITAGNPAAPQGGQVGFIQRTGTISQDVNFPEAGTYSIDVSAAQRANLVPSQETVQVLVDGNLVGTIFPVGTAYATYTTGSFHVTPGSHTITLQGVIPSRADYTALIDLITVHNVSPLGLTNPGFVNLSPAFNRTGIVTDGAAFGYGGLDGNGYAFSSGFVGASLTASGTTFHLGPANVPDAVSAEGQVVPLPAVQGSALKILATGVNGAQPDQTFLVTYADGTTATFTQSISDWAVPKGYAGESTALTTSYRNSYDSGNQSGPFHVYVYTFSLDPSKVVQSLTLPTNANVEVLAASLVPQNTTPVDLSSAFNRTGAVADGTALGGGGLDGVGYALSSNLVGTSLTASGATFQLGPNAVSAAGQVIALPSVQGSELKLLALGVQGSQPDQRFVVTYTDGTTATFTQSISDWAVPMGYTGESTALTTTYRDSSDGSPQAGPFRLYAYTFSLDPSKVVQSLTLPTNANVEVLAASLVPQNTTPVDLSSAFNRTGAVSEGVPFTDGGLDNGGTAFSASLVGASLTASGVTFHLGSQVVSAAGQVIPLPPVQSDSLKLLATGVNGSQPDQTFLVTYTDGSTATFTQSVSDWAYPQGYSGETTALTTTYRNTSSGGQQAGPFRLYAYTFSLDPTRVMKSLTLPTNANVEVFAATLVPTSATQADLSSAFNRAAIAADGAAFSGGGIDGVGYAFSSSQTGTSVTAGGAKFHLGPVGGLDVVSAAGQVIALPAVQRKTLKLLATGVNGAQPNQTFVVTYTDGTSSTFTQSVSDWAIPMGYAGETTALTTTYRDTSSGGQQAGPFHMYVYSFALDPTREVKSLVLPSNPNLEVLAVDLLS